MSLEKTLLNHPYLIDAMHILRECEANEVLPFLYGLDDIEKYLEDHKDVLKKEIIEFFKYRYEWLETGELVEFDHYFFEDILSLQGIDLLTLPKFIKSKKTKRSQIKAIHDILFLKSQFTKLKTEF